ncbi:MAG: SDR family oxidoreductase [Polyangiaceae bacterium]|nr:SDR family oxidoreductase [Polyangiaceae bacterium]
MGIVAVTGANGFIGSRVVRALLAKGRRVRALVEPNSDLGNLADLTSPDLDVATCDVLDAASLRKTLSGSETLYHLAAVYKVWMQDPTPIYKVNVTGSTNALLAARSSGVKKVVFTSSIAALGLKEGGIADESTPFNTFDCASDYHYSKWMSEEVALAFAKDGLHTVIVNPAFPFGPGDRAPTPTGKILLLVLRKEVPAMLPGGLCAIDVDDCAEGHLLAEEKGVSGERYILGNHNVSLRALVELTAKEAGMKMWAPNVPKSIARAWASVSEMNAKRTHEEPPVTRRSAEYAMRSAYFSNAKAVRELGLPTRPLSETVRRAIEWFRHENMV